LKKAFASFGTISDAFLPHRGSRFAFVTFEEEASAAKAVAEMNGKSVPDDDTKTELKLTMARERPARKKGRKQSRKSKKEGGKKEEAQGAKKADGGDAEAGKGASKKQARRAGRKEFDKAEFEARSAARMDRYESELEAKCHLFGMLSNGAAGAQSGALQAVQASLFQEAHSVKVSPGADGAFSVKVTEGGKTLCEYDSTSQNKALTAAANQLVEALFNEVKYSLSYKAEVVALNGAKVDLLMPVRKMRFPPVGSKEGVKDPLDSVRSEG